MESAANVARLNRRSPALVKDPVLYHSAVDKMGHLAAKRIYLTDKVPFRKPSDGRIAAHTAYRIKRLCNQKSLKTFTRESKAGLYTSMAAPDHYRIIIHISLPQAERREKTFKHIIIRNLASQLTKR